MLEVRLEGENIDPKKVRDELRRWLDGLEARPRKVLLLPPDYTRFHSMAGMITSILYRMLAPACRVEIMPALGTHFPMTDDEKEKMFGREIPPDCFVDHDWRREIVKIGEVPADYVAQVSGGLVRYPIDLEVNRRLMDKDYDLIISIGQVVPHEVVGMANYSKNIFVGCGGKDIINKSHFLGAAYGMERIMGRDGSPVRKVFDYAEEKFLADMPLRYILTVTTTEAGTTRLNGLYAGRSRRLFEDAVRLSQRLNLNLLDEPLRKVVVYLDPGEFKSTWLGNKAIYRTRMALADRGELIVLAPGLKQFGEDGAIDALIRKYGYLGSKRLLQLVEEETDLRNNLSAAAHMIHGSSEGRFTICYAPGGLSREEIERANFQYLPLTEAAKRYDPSRLRDGFNTMPDGEEIFFISNPALGLWALREKFR